MIAPMSRPVSCNRLFVYGTLCHEPLRVRLLGRKVRVLPARLPGYRRRPVIGEDYPALVRQSGGAVEGLVLLGLKRADLTRVDRYEGEEYRRTLCRVWAAGRQVRAWVYLWQDRRARLEAGR